MLLCVKRCCCVLGHVFVFFSGSVVVCQDVLCVKTSSVCRIALFRVVACEDISFVCQDVLLCVCVDVLCNDV